MYQYRGTSQKFIENTFHIYTSVDVTNWVEWPVHFKWKYCIMAEVGQNISSSNQSEIYYNYYWQQTNISKQFSSNLEG